MLNGLDQCITVCRRTARYPFVHYSVLFLGTFPYFHLPIYIFLCCTFSMLHSFHVALFSYCTISMLHFLLCFTLFMYCSISCCTLTCYTIFVLDSSSVALFAFCNFFVLHFVHVVIFPEV